jgi:hypothetical protein
MRKWLRSIAAAAIAAVAVSAGLLAPSAHAQFFGGGSIPPNSYWSHPEINFVQDSLGAYGDGYVVNTPISFTANLASGNTTLTNVSSVAGLLPGMGLFDPAHNVLGAYIVSMSTPPCPCTIVVSAAPAGNETGETIYGLQPVGFGNGIAQTPGYSANSIAFFLEAITFGQLQWHPERAPYNNYYLGLYAVTVADGGGGSGYSSTSTWTASAPPAGVQLMPGTITCAANGVGGLASCQPPTPAGSGYTSIPTFTCNTGCGTGGALAAIISDNGTFSMPGATCAQVVTELPYVIAARPSLVIAGCGSNDNANSIPLTTTESEIQKLVSGLLNAGIRVVLMKIAPRSGGGFTGYKAVILNHFIETLARSTFQAGGYMPGVMIADPARYEADATNSSTPGAPLSWVTVDGAHHSFGGGLVYAASILQAMGWNTGLFTPTSFDQSDVYNASTMPDGNLFGTEGLFLGSGGTNSCANVTGPVATGWTLTCSSTVTGTIALENPRTDALSGVREVINITSDAGGAAADSVTLTANVTGSNIAAGDKLVGSMEVEYSNYNNVSAGGCELTTDNGAVGYLAGYNTNNNSTYLPPYTQFRTLPMQGILRGFVQGATGGNFSLLHQTRDFPAISMGANQAGLKCRWQIDSTQASTSLTVKVSNANLHKVQ